MIEIKTYAPILIPTLNRYEHFCRCVESLAKCTHANQTELIIGLDYPPNDKYYDGWKRICDYLPSIKGFFKITVIKREYNYGAVKNIQELEEYAHNYYDRYILTEDDNEFSPNFLDFINKGLEAYKDNPKVLGICGYNYPNLDMSSYDRDYYFSHEMSAWGWGSWFNERCTKAQLTIQDPAYLYKLIKNISFRLFMSNGMKRCNLLYNIGREFLGDAYYTYYEWNCDMYCMFPKLSLVRNLGHDGSGLHCGDSKGHDPYCSQIIDERISFDDAFDIPVCYNKQIQRILKSFQRSNWKYKIKKVVLLVLIKLFVIIRGY